MADRPDRTGGAPATPVAAAPASLLTAAPGGAGGTAPVDVVAVPPSLPLDRATALYGTYRWAERRVFELAGAWAVGTAEPAVRVHLDVVSRQHAWHADLWAERLPVLDGVDREALTRPGHPAVATVLERLAAAPGTVARLAGLYRVVVPRLLVTYERHLAMLSPVADQPAARALRLVRRDELESWEAGEALLQALLAGPERAAEAATAQAAVEGALVAARVGRGLVPWPADEGGVGDTGGRDAAAGAVATGASGRVT